MDAAPDVRSSQDTDADTASRPVAPGGWKRALIGFAVGLAAGAIIALVLPRDDPSTRPR